MPDAVVTVATWSPTELVTDRLLLRPWEPSDAAAVYAAVQDPEIPRWTRVPSPYAMSDAEQFTGELSPAGWRDGSEALFGAFLADGTLVCSIGLMNRNRKDDLAEIGYWTAAPHRRQGLTVEAVQAVTTWAFGPGGLHRVELFADPRNTGSNLVAERSGYQREGLLRSRLAHRDGRRSDAVLWAAVRP